MFSEVMDALSDNVMPEPGLLRKRFDFAVTKKMGILRLPPAFWMGDQKINPRADHLLMASLLLKDRQRIETALTILIVELAETSSLQESECRETAARRGGELVRQLLGRIPDAKARKQLEQELHGLVPEWFAPGAGPL